MGKKFIATCQGQETPIEIEEVSSDQIKVKSGSKEWVLDLHQAGSHHYSVIHEGKSYDLRFFHEENNVSAFLHGEHLYFTLDDARRDRSRPVPTSKGGATLKGPAEIKATMPGKVVKVHVKKGDKVKEGEGLVIVEAMKMENEMVSNKAGVVSQLKVVEGQSVESGTLMVVIE